MVMDSHCELQDMLLIPFMHISESQPQQVRVGWIWMGRYDTILPESSVQFFSIEQCF